MILWLKKLWNPNYPYKIGYKVLSKVGDKLYSSSPNGGCAIEYSTTETNHRPKDSKYGPLYVFSLSDSACHFADILNRNFRLAEISTTFEVWECKYLPSKDNPYCAMMNKRFADELTLIKRVY